MLEPTQVALDEKSKSQIKRELQALQKLGVRLTECSPELLGALPLSDLLRKALAEASKHQAHSARKRHLQYIGKLLRDADIEAIYSILDPLDSTTRQYQVRLHALEQWRTELLTSDAALALFIDTYPETNRQHLRQLVRQAQYKTTEGKPPLAVRKLFKYIRAIDEAQRGLN